jgi:hypothetical protein
VSDAVKHRFPAVPKVETSYHTTGLAGEYDQNCQWFDEIEITNESGKGISFSIVNVPEDTSRNIRGRIVLKLELVTEN